MVEETIQIKEKEALSIYARMMHLQIFTFKTEKWTRNRTSTSYEFL